jgi:AraC-like DNA-binding protein
LTAADELMLDTPPTRPCTHRRVHHGHGTRGRYAQDGCRCLRCRLAAAAYQADRDQAIAYGRWQAFADAAEPRRHVRTLMRAGLSWKTVAERAGLSEETVKALLYGRNGKKVTRIRTRTARKLLAVQAGRRRTPQPPDLLTTEAT